MANPITNFKNQVDDSRGPIQDPGWYFYPTDTNTGAGGKYIDIGRQRKAGGEPVTDLEFKAYDSAQSAPPSGYRWTGQDLNQGAGGSYIRPYYTTSDYPTELKEE